jgi:hypothetical protein
VARAEIRGIDRQAVQNDSPNANAERPAMNVKKIVTWALVVFVVFYLLTDPNGAAGFVSHVLNGLKSAGKSLSTFLSHL